MVLDLLLSFLIGNTIGRAFLIVTRFWLKRAIREVVSTTRVEWAGRPAVEQGIAYPNMSLPLRIISKTNVELTLEEIKGEVRFGSLDAGFIFWFNCDGEKIERKGDWNVMVSFVPPLQVFLLGLGKCHIINGIANFSCLLGKVIVPFYTDSSKIDNFEQGVKIVKELLSSKQ